MGSWPLNPVRVTKFRVATGREWDRIWSLCGYATFFHSREWAEVWQNCSDGEIRPVPLLLGFSDGARAILPLVWLSREQRYLSSAAETYGGLISLGPVDSRHLAALAGWAPKAIGRVFIRSNPFAEHTPADALPWQLHHDETQVLSLADGMEAIFNGWSKGHKSAAAKARREGVTVSPATTRQAWLEYFGLYQDSVKRWGDKVSSRYPWALFERMYELRSPNVKLWLAFHEGRAISGALCFYSRKHVVYWHGASLGEHFSLRPVHLLLHEVIRHAVDGGFSWFDFNPSGGHEGVRSFKKGFGASAMPAPWLEAGATNRLKGWSYQLRAFFHLWKGVE